MDEKKRIIEFDAAESVPVDGQLPIDSASQGTKKITPALLLKAITDLLGDEALDTLAQTLTGAVNEVKGIADDAQDLAENISDEYSSSSAYAKGDYCIHNNTLYKCTTAIGSGGEAWNASHWSATKCDDELSELKGTLDDLVNYLKVVSKSKNWVTTFEYDGKKTQGLYMFISLDQITFIETYTSGNIAPRNATSNHPWSFTSNNGVITGTTSTSSAYVLIKIY